MSHEPRINYNTAAPETARALFEFSRACGKTLGLRLKELVQLRISQINGCAFCIDMHWAALIKEGLEPRHINAIAGWREAHRFFDARERAALAWAESVNAVPHRAPSDAEFAQLREHFSEAEITDLTFTVCAIRAWNMLNASFLTQMPEKPFSPR